MPRISPRLFCLLSVAAAVLFGCTERPAPTDGLPVNVDGFTLDPPVASVLQQAWTTSDEFAAKRTQQRALLLSAEGRTQFRAAVDRSWIEGTRVEATTVASREISIPGPAGDIQAYVLTPEVPTGTRPLVVLYFHGGGWLFASKEAALPSCRELAAGTGAIFVVADYRLAPEHSYPAAHEDAYAAYAWTVANAQTLGGSGRVAVGGDSAGGNMAMSVAVREIMNSGTVPDGLLLNYPVLDLNVADYASFQTFSEGYTLDRYFAELSEDLFLPDPTVKQDPLASPLLFAEHADFSAMPPTVVATAGFDILRDQGRALAAGLEAAGRPVTHLEFGALIHGYLQHTMWSDAALAASRQTADAIVDRIRIYD